MDAQLRERLEALLSVIDGAVELFESRNTLREGCDFVAEFCLFKSRTPYETAVLVSLNVLDHVRFVAKAVLSGDRLTAFAPFSIVRSALTGATLAAWILDENPNERRRRTLTITHHELKNQRNAFRGLADAPERPNTEANVYYNTRREQARNQIAKVNAQIAEVRTDAAAFGFDFDEIKRKPYDTDIVEIGAAVISPDLPYYEDFGKQYEAVRTWRTLSAHAHGFSWAAELTTATANRADGSKVHAFDPQGEDLLQGIQVVWDVFYGVMDRFIILAGARE
ncbi:hypothetical protein CH295_22930 [Rhodococcus sp. 14-2483-1-2]|nr:hypothetical protein CH295_22930 [Rhodococcus sp. 14-2483-1-2]